ncbi:adenylate/guanylate cyclase domain-containing protein [uncultured Phenylobacterium sp.]|uniref:adenylate/guanylate cyclase domain-containing protein n=1 Tax=uncultured Phenylobacterium sp. TaxID=349273 RepID=UPI0025E77414|nr:adenylate/guanylate cyclase domain-containing protein [uncultured Phenylobacterium sp.]
MSERKAVAAVRAALARGDLLSAYDLARQRTDDAQGPALDYLEVLTLARLGDHERALRLYEAYGLGGRNDVDALSLRARLLKDAGFAGRDGGDQAMLLEACRLYASVYDRTADAYPAINAATLALIVGSADLAREMAQAAVRHADADPEPGYYTLATLAEARLVMGDMAGARAALAAALAAADADVGARSTTVLQLRRLIEVIGGGAEAQDLLTLIRPPSVVTYRGHIFLGDPQTEAALAARVRAALVAERVGFAYGSLAAGSDILIAEQLLAHRAELHIVLPVTEADFLAQSVQPAGGRWMDRYAACREAATSVTFASSMSHVGGQGQFAYGSRVAMGMARLRARHLNGEALQLAIVEEAAGTGAQTRSDLRAWHDTGGRSVVIETGPLARPQMPRPTMTSEVTRGAYGLMFTDFPGFARLDERFLPLFQQEVMARAAACLNRHASSVLHKNTWGDALYVVYETVLSGAEAALDLCDTFKDVDPRQLGLRQGAAMRIALHFGPTYFDIDPVTERPNFYGSEVSRAARIEPVTPPGSVYVTEPFAAILAMEPAHDFICDYVGQVELPKGYGVFPLYRLRRTRA